MARTIFVKCGKRFARGGAQSVIAPATGVQWLKCLEDGQGH